MRTEICRCGTVLGLHLSKSKRSIARRTTSLAVWPSLPVRNDLILAMSAKGRSNVSGAELFLERVAMGRKHQTVVDSAEPPRHTSALHGQRNFFKICQVFLDAL